MPKPKSTTQREQDKYNFIERYNAAIGNLQAFQQRVIQVCRLRARKHPLSFAKIADWMGFASKAAAFHIYKANKPHIKSISRIKLRRK